MEQVAVNKIIRVFVYNNLRLGICALCLTADDRHISDKLYDSMMQSGWV